MNRIKITAFGFPWQHVRSHWSTNVDKTHGQKYGWNPLNVKGMGRFGGGWAFKFGVQISRDLRDWVFDLGLGSIRIIFEKKEQQ